MTRGGPEFRRMPSPIYEADYLIHWWDMLVCQESLYVVHYPLSCEP